MRVEHDKIGPYREVTNRLANSPRETFMCATCKQGKSILGRRKVGMAGRRTLWCCAACAAK